MCVSSAMLKAGAELAQGFSDNSTAKANAKLAEAEGQSAVVAANYRAGQIRGAGERAQSSTRAAQAASGVDLSYGSAVDVGEESAVNIEKDALLAAFQGEQQRAAKRFQAQLYKQQGKAAQFNAILSAGGTILGSAEAAATGGMGGSPAGLVASTTPGYRVGA